MVMFDLVDQNNSSLDIFIVSQQYRNNAHCIRIKPLVEFLLVFTMVARQFCCQEALRVTVFLLYIPPYEVIFLPFLSSIIITIQHHCNCLVLIWVFYAA